jgi:hypothetical protein
MENDHVFLQTFDANTKQNFKQNDKNGLALLVKPVNAPCIDENWMTFTSLNDENTLMC